MKLSFNHVLLALNIVLFCWSQSVLAEGCDASYHALTQEKLETLIAPLQQGKIVRASFQQQRVMRLLKKPLMAEGSMIVAPDLGLYWQVDKPFPYQLIVTSSRFVQISGNDKKIIRAEEQPAIFAMSRILSDLFSGHFVEALHYFSLKGKSIDRPSADSAWALCLVPIQAPLDQLISSIQIEGNAHIRSVKISDANRDYTEIVFSFLDKKTTDKTADNTFENALTDVEKRYFNVP